jgi:hypothetical protein
MGGMTFQRYMWILFFIIGIGLAVFAYDNIVVIPALDPADPERGWQWLSTDPEVIDYIKFWFRNFGFWVLAVSIFVMVIALTGFRNGERWAWFSMLYLPVHIGIHAILWPWLAPAILIVVLITLIGLLVPFRVFFPRGGPIDEVR